MRSVMIRSAIAMLAGAAATMAHAAPTAAPLAVPPAVPLGVLAPGSGDVQKVHHAPYHYCAWTRDRRGRPYYTCWWDKRLRRRGYY